MLKIIFKCSVCLVANSLTTALVIVVGAGGQATSSSSCMQVWVGLTSSSCANAGKISQ